MSVVFELTNEIARPNTQATLIDCPSLLPTSITPISQYEQWAGHILLSKTIAQPIFSIT
jgi:hypothetical protein